MKNLRAIYIIWYRDILRFWRDRMRMVGAIAFPLLFLLVFGIGLTDWVDLGPGVNFSKFMFPGIIGMTVLMTSFMSGVSIVWDREFGFLKEVLVAPISRSAVAVGKMLGGATIATIQGTVILLLGPLLGVNLSAGLVFRLLPLIFLVACALASMGILLASRIRSMEAFQAMMQMLTFPMIFLSGVFFPVSRLPSWMSVLVKINPATYGIDPIRKVVLGSSAAAWAQTPGLPAGASPFTLTVFGHPMTIAEDLIVISVFGAVMILLAMRSFGTQE